MSYGCPFAHLLSAHKYNCLQIINDKKIAAHLNISPHMFVLRPQTWVFRPHIWILVARTSILARACYFPSRTYESWRRTYEFCATHENVGFPPLNFDAAHSTKIYFYYRTSESQMRTCESFLLAAIPLWQFWLQIRHVRQMRHSRHQCHGHVTTACASIALLNSCCSSTPRNQYYMRITEYIIYSYYRSIW